MNTAVFKCFSYKKDIELCIRPAHRIDAALWSEVFGDSESDIRAFVSACVSSAYCVAFCSHGVTVSQFLAIEASICGVRGIYIYALCTSPEHRGRGLMRELIGAARAHFEKFGYRYFMLLPASEALADTYKKMGFTHSLSAYATPLPEREGDFFGVDGGVLSSYKQKEYGKDVGRLYELSSRVFSYEFFRYSVSSFGSLLKVKLFTDNDGNDGFALMCGERIFLTSERHSAHVQSVGKIAALVMPWRELPPAFYNAIPEPLPR